MEGQNTRPDCGGQHRAIHILARSISRELLSQGYESRHLVDLAGELLDVACDSLRVQRLEPLDGKAVATRLFVDLDPDFHAPAAAPTLSPWWHRQWERPGAPLVATGP